ncbi:MAG TPA: (d)CMP kinase [Candidatus Paceibacterota bacterium]|nr:(d)CMP kinase [Candidatus Pacearchaeota archaeon]HRR94673.1 (d)CMP kinase [Candidatus Paceibacterota bacterium]HRU20825.1 (d)CMP kinase [Candidatus Paceibacterota bacterium]
MIITFDGKAGMGKGTLATLLANTLGIPHYDIGLMFRKIAVLSREMKFCEINKLISLDVSYDDNYLSSETVGIETAKLAEKYSSIMSAIVRAKIKDKNFVCDGRTAGTEVYPEADIKFFLICSYQERCRRRNTQLSLRDSFDAKRLKTPEGAHILNTTDKDPEDLLKEVLNYIY